MRIFALMVVVLAAICGAQTRIVCVGNSITEDGRGYVGKLQTLLGSGSIVYNEGHLGATMLRAGDVSYWSTDHFKNVFTRQPRLITIKLGTNDSKATNWNAGRYEADLNALIDTFSTMASHPGIWLVLPVPAFPTNTFGIRGDTVHLRIVPIIQRVASQRGLPVIDAHTPLLGRSNLFPDGVHPSAAGSDSIARYFYRALTTMPCMQLSMSEVLLVHYHGDANPSGVPVSVTNMGLSTTLNAISAAKGAAWLTLSTTTTNRANQQIVNTADCASLSQTDARLSDTVTVTCTNAFPPSVKYVVNLWMRARPVFSGVKVTEDGARVASGRTHQFRAWAIDQYGDSMAAPGAFSWSATGGTIGASTGLYTAGGIWGEFRVTATCSGRSDTAAIEVARLPYLPLGYIKDLLVFTNAGGSPYFPRHDSVPTYDFLEGSGLDGTAAPHDGMQDTLTRFAIPGAWHHQTDGDGMWFDGTAAEGSVTYAAIYLVCDAARSVYFRYRCDDGARIFVNGGTVAVKNSNDAGVELESMQKVRLNAGVNRVIIKTWEVTGDSYFALRIVDTLRAEVSDLEYQFTDVAPVLPVASPRLDRPVDNVVVALRPLCRAGLVVSFGTPAPRHVELVSMQGRVVSTAVSHGAACALDAPAGAGAYIIRVRTHDGRVFAQSVVLR